MLRELKIENFALIDNITVEFNEGFNVLTGETGAGKSLLLDSIGLLCGNRANSTFIRKGADKAIVEGVFELNEDILLRLNNLDYLEIEDATMVMSREVALNGSNKCKINYRVVPLNIYKEFGDILFEIHAQNQEQSIMDKGKQLDLLDKYISRDEAIKNILEEVKNLSNSYKNLEDKLRSLNSEEDTKNDLIEYYRYAIKEINDANIEPLEDEKLKEERNIIANSERLVKNSSAINEEFSMNITDGLNRVLHNLREIEKIDNKVGDISKRVESIYYEAEDIANTFKNYSQSLEFDERRLNEIEIRLSQINKVKSKYGNTLEEVFIKLEDMEKELDNWENKSINLDRINVEIKEVRKDYFLKANKLFEVRKKGALEIENIIKEKLEKLNIYKDGFEIKVEISDEVSKKGSVDVEFLFSGNKGEELLPLKKVASGGEVSRIMLAFKEFFSELDFIPTLIFDEIDSGIGGETLLMIAEALNLIGSKRQVICVTHSPIIAAFSDRIISVKKVEEKDRMIVDLVPLEGENEVIVELSRMLGGDKNFTTAKEQSLEMLKFAMDRKKV